MAGIIARRAASGLLTLLVASVLVFGALHAIPGDPVQAIAGVDASPETVHAVRESLGLGRPLVAQYGLWLWHLVRLDLGTSYRLGGPVSALVAHGLANTVVLAVSAIALAIVLSLVVSLVWVTRPSRWLDLLAGAAVTLAVSVPSFVTGVLGVLLFAIVWPVLPSGGVPPKGFFADPGITAQYLLLPATCLALPAAATLTRFLSEALRDEWEQPYVLTARALGTPRWRILTGGVLRNAVPTYITTLGLQVGGMLGGAVLIEAIFAWPGLGQLMSQGVGARDYPVVQALVLLAVTVFVVVQIFTDIIQVLLDPRVRLEA